MLKPGRCRWCGCTQTTPCPGSCGWANADHTLCTACVDVDREWNHLQPRRGPNMRRAFFRGFMVGTDDERAEDVRYPTGATARVWEHARGLGRRAAR